MTRSSIRRVLAIATLVFFFVSASFLYLRYFSGDQQHLSSPDGAYTAFVRSSGSLSALDSDIAMVQIRKGWGPERALLFQVSADNAAIKLSWVGPRVLQIACHGCSMGHTDEQKNTWRDVSITYSNN
jgi:hypothetical protein